MEVLCEAAIFVKPQSRIDQTYDVLHLTNIDQLFGYYRSIILGYKVSGKEQGDEAAADPDPAGAVRCGVEEMVVHYPWAAGRLRVAAAPHGVERHRRLEVCLDGEGGSELGVQFVSARANCLLDDLGDLGEPCPSFVPLFATINLNAPLYSRPLVALQVTSFEDGGVCVSMNWYHGLFDAIAASIFLQNISSCARGAGLCVHVDKAPRELRIKPGNVLVPSEECEWPSYLPELFTKELTEKQQASLEPIAATRFDFSEEDVAQLRVEALSKQQDCAVGFSACSRFQVLAAHLWRAKAKSLVYTGSIIKEPAELPLRIAVNVRGRIVASIPRNYMGNAIAFATARATEEELREKSLAFAVARIQEAISEVTAKRFQAAVDYMEMLGGSALTVPAEMAITFVAGGQLGGFYDADFGWGKPAFLGGPYTQRPTVLIISHANAATSFKVVAAFDSQVVRHKFQAALINLSS